MSFLHFCSMCSLASVLIQTNATPNQDGYLLQPNMILDSAKEAKQLVDAAYLKTRTNLRTRMKREAPRVRDMMAFLKQPTGTTRNYIRSADYLDLTRKLITEKLKVTHPEPFNISDVLTAEQNEILSQLTGCAYRYLPKVCDDSPYRTFSGECNNRKNPILGASNTGFKRLLEPEYEDKNGLPRGWTESRPINGFPLPSARAVSNELVMFPTESTTYDESRSIMFMQWGQFLDHDTDLSPDSPMRSTVFQGVDCDQSCVQEYPCFPIMVSVNDSRYVNGSECIPLVRSAPVCNLVTPVREQINVLTAYVDASQVYGSDNKLAMKLRNNTNQLGLMAVNEKFTDNGLHFLPFIGLTDDQCVITNQSLGIPCFLAGDIRVSEQPGLTAFHTLKVREHNRIATQLHKLNPNWTGEILFQETRKIIGAIMQKVTYKDWLPMLLGNKMSVVIPKYESYNETEDPSVTNCFTIAYRMGHTFVHPFYYKLAEGYIPYTPDPVVPFHETFFTSWRVVTKGGIDPIVRGMLVNKAKLNRQDQIMIDDLRERLYITINRIGLDLASLNIQRGRDHGLPGYNAWRRFCGLSAPQNIEELAIVLENRKLAKSLIKLYGTPENIDIWIGGVSEPLVLRGRTGELFSCLIGDHFRRARDGDRFYYENPSVFSLEQRRSIERVSLAHIICANTNIKQVPQNVFISNWYPEGFIKCSNMPALDLQPWKAVTTHSSTEDNSTSEED